MQIAGSKCGQCGRSITTILDGVVCSACDIAYHHACLPENKNCPKCEIPCLAEELPRSTEQTAPANPMPFQLAGVGVMLLALVVLPLIGRVFIAGMKEPASWVIVFPIMRFGLMIWAVTLFWKGWKARK